MKYPRRTSVDQTILAEIERMELEKIAKSEMEEDIALYDKMDHLVGVGRPGGDFDAEDLQTIRDYNRTVLFDSVGEPLDVEAILKKFRQERDSKATAKGWDGVTRDGQGRPVIVTTDDIILEIGRDRILTTTQLDDDKLRTLTEVEFLSEEEMLKTVSILEKEDPSNWSVRGSAIYYRLKRYQADQELFKKIRKQSWPQEAKPELNEEFRIQQEQLKAELGEKPPKEGPVMDALNTPTDQPWLASLSEEEVIRKRKDMEDGIGVKYNKGKPRIAQIIPVLWIRRLVEVLEYGCSNKYSMHNWKGLEAKDLLDSAGRHFLDIMEGLQDEDNPMIRDDESKLYHIYQAAWNLLAAGYVEEKRLNTKVKTVTVSKAFAEDAKGYYRDDAFKPDMTDELVLVPASDLENLLNKRLEEDDETTIYASDVYALIDSCRKENQNGS